MTFPHARPGLARCGTITNSDVLSNESSTMTEKSSAISADFHCSAIEEPLGKEIRPPTLLDVPAQVPARVAALLERARIWTTEIARLGSTLFLKVRIAADIGPPGGGRSEHFLDQGSIAIRAPQPRARSHRRHGCQRAKVTALRPPICRRDAND